MNGLVRANGLRCLFGERDDLHDYAAAVRATLHEHLAAHPISTLGSDSFECAVAHRMGGFQAEVVHMHPDAPVPMHIHPNVDSIDLMVSGHLNLAVDGKWIGEGHELARRTEFMRQFGIRIASSAPHGGSAGPEGVVFVSCQRWKIPPSHIALDWKGAPCSPEHARLMESLARIQ